MTKSDAGITSVGVHEAKTNLSRLLRLVESGAEVQIMRGLTPVARLVRIEAAPPKRQLGTLRDKIWIADDFDAELSITDSFENSDLFPA